MHICVLRKILTHVCLSDVIFGVQNVSNFCFDRIIFFPNMGSLLSLPFHFSVANATSVIQDLSSATELVFNLVNSLL